MHRRGEPASEVGGERPGSLCDVARPTNFSDNESERTSFAPKQFSETQQRDVLKFGAAK
ncbi:hypothetical protein MINTM007_09270 [Mycobacterium intracellulare]|nr:hypothetical protein MINTM007_09270 [Mycobacterium intracellulare]